MVGQVQELVMYMTSIRKELEVEEDYEGCASLRDAVNRLQEYVLGYKSYEDVMDEVYFWVQHFGEVLIAEDEHGMYYLTYHTDIPNLNWVFYVDKEEYLLAVRTIESRKKKPRAK